MQRALADMGDDMEVDSEALKERQSLQAMCGFDEDDTESLMNWAIRELCNECKVVPHLDYIEALDDVYTQVAGMVVCFVKYI